MALKGGYQMLDITGTYTEGVATIDGIYAKAQNNKAKLVGGVIDGEAQLTLLETYLAFEESSGSYVANLTVGGEAYTITIADDDTVTLAAAQ